MVYITRATVSRFHFYLAFSTITPEGLLNLILEHFNVEVSHSGNMAILAKFLLLSVVWSAFGGLTTGAGSARDDEPIWDVIEDTSIGCKIDYLTINNELHVGVVGLESTLGPGVPTEENQKTCQLQFSLMSNGFEYDTTAVHSAGVMQLEIGVHKTLEISTYRPKRTKRAWKDWQGPLD
ncbi:hypothetical protein FQN57_003691 [Myotisia sp. PD_48]|nr:hypothetical protein FQN57_003691 [Myotisia sp. PD_48]